MTGLNTAPGSKIGIEIVGYYDQLPSGGMAPIRVAIRNDSGRARRWTFQFRSDASHILRRSVVFDWEVEVDSGQEQRFDLLVPLAVVDIQNFSYPSLMVTVNGYGLISNNASYSGSRSYSGKPHTGSTAMSEALVVETEGPLRSQLDTQGFELVMCALDPDWLSDDWRAYQGFASVWIADQDWDRMRESQRAAVLNWVWQGGTLHYVGRALGAEALARVGLPALGGEETIPASAFGAGLIRTVRWSGGPLPQESVAWHILDSHPRSHVGAILDRYPSQWDLVRMVPERVLRVGVLILALLVFALVVGPVNLVVLAGRSRRHRLFVTTPVISLVASVLLAVLILLQDGVGGSGVRMAVLYLMPSARQEWLVQEQLSRTGVLLGSRFDLPRDVYMVQLPLGSNREQQKQLRRELDAADGDWFSSRNRQGQYLSAVRPSRSRVEVLNSVGVRDRGDAPVLISTMEEALVDVFYRDVHGGFWRADRLRVGERAELRPSNRQEFDGVWGPGRRYPLAFRSLAIEASAGHPHGFVYAGSENPGARLIDTLRSIRWEDDAMVVVGPCVSAEEGRG